MKKARSVALIGAGKFTDSSLSHFYWLTDRLGPVKSSSFRLASRIVNHLAAGFPVRDYQDFHACDLIVVCVPDAMLERVLGELASSAIDFTGKAVVLASSWRDSSELREFSARRAAVGSICQIPGLDGVRYLLEGDALAVRRSRLLVEHRDRRAISIERSLKPFYLAALTCTGSVLFSILLAATESLQHAGVARSVSAGILEEQIGLTLRRFVRAGRKPFPVPQELSKQLRTVAAADPELGHYMEQSTLLAERLLENRKYATASS